jgi:hypothetical protein
MNLRDRSVLLPLVAKAKESLNAAVDDVEALRASVRNIEGDLDGLVFFPCTRPDPSRQQTEYSAWLERVDAILSTVTASR